MAIWTTVNASSEIAKLRADKARLEQELADALADAAFWRHESEGHAKDATYFENLWRQTNG